MKEHPAVVCLCVCARARGFDGLSELWSWEPCLDSDIGPCSSWCVAVLWCCHVLCMGTAAERHRYWRNAEGSGGAVESLVEALQEAKRHVHSVTQTNQELRHQLQRQSADLSRSQHTAANLQKRLLALEAPVQPHPEPSPPRYADVPRPQCCWRWCACGGTLVCRFVF